MIVRWWRQVRVDHALARLPLRRAAEIRANERVSVRGQVVRAEDDLVAPLSRHRCVYFELRVSAPNGAADESGNTVAFAFPRLRFVHQASVDFYVDDGTVPVRVSPEGARFGRLPEVQEASLVTDVVPARIADLLLREGGARARSLLAYCRVSRERHLMSSSFLVEQDSAHRTEYGLEYSESILEVGAAALAGGRACLEPDPLARPTSSATGYRASANIPVLRCQREEPLFIATPRP